MSRCIQCEKTLLLPGSSRFCSRECHAAHDAGVIVAPSPEKKLEKAIHLIEHCLIWRETTTWSMIASELERLRND